MKQLLIYTLLEPTVVDYVYLQWVDVKNSICLWVINNGIIISFLVAHVTSVDGGLTTLPVAYTSNTTYHLALTHYTTNVFTSAAPPTFNYAASTNTQVHWGVFGYSSPWCQLLVIGY